MELKTFTINWLTRYELEEIIESRGYAVYDHETTDELRDHVISMVSCGEILESELV